MPTEGGVVELARLSHYEKLPLCPQVHGKSELEQLRSSECGLAGVPHHLPPSAQHSGDDWLLDQALQVSPQKLILAVLGTQGRRREFGFFSFEGITSCDEVTRGGNAGRKVFFGKQLPATSGSEREDADAHYRLLPRSVISRSQDKLMHQRLKGVTLCRRWWSRTEVQLDALIKTQTVRRQPQRLSGVG